MPVHQCGNPLHDVLVWVVATALPIVIGYWGHIRSFAVKCWRRSDV